MKVIRISLILFAFSTCNAEIFQLRSIQADGDAAWKRVEHPVLGDNALNLITDNRAQTAIFTALEIPYDDDEEKAAKTGQRQPKRVRH